MTKSERLRRDSDRWVVLANMYGGFVLIPSNELADYLAGVRIVLVLALAVGAVYLSL